jgi:hypothetical protein
LVTPALEAKGQVLQVLDSPTKTQSVELPLDSFVARRSIQLSYGRTLIAQLALLVLYSLFVRTWSKT